MKHIIITIAVALVTFIAGFFIGDATAIGRVNKQIDVKVRDTYTQPAEQSQEPKTYSIGDTIQVGDYILTLNKVFLTKERNQFTKEKFDKVAVIEYTYKNLGTEELFISEMDFKVYDEQGNTLKTYPAGVNKMSKKVSKDKQCTAEMAFGFNTGTKLEVHYYDNVFNSTPDAIFIIEVK